MGIMYTSTRSKRKKAKPNSAQRELARAEKELVDKWANAPLFGGKFVSASKKKLTARQRADLRAQIESCPVVDQGPKSLMTPGGSTAKKISPQYTGTKMLGIGQLHKSNAIPVFQSEDAVDIAKMRR